MRAAAVLCLISVMAVPAAAQEGDPLKELQEQNRLLKEQIEELKKSMAPAPQAPAPAAAPLPPGCLAAAGATYCPGWIITVNDVDPRAGTASPVGRYVAKNQSDIVMMSHNEAVPFMAQQIGYHGEAYLNAPAAGAYGFTLQSTPAHGTNPCTASFALQGEELITTNGHARRSGSASRQLQPGMYLVSFDFSCRTYH